jgi:hypothetical protein
MPTTPPPDNTSMHAHLCGLVLGCVVVLSCVTSPAHAQWTPTNTPQGFTPTVLAIDDSNFYAGHNKGLLYSNDRGASWSSATKGLPAGRITALAVRRVSGGVMLFAGTQLDGIYLSIDNGGSWNPVDQTPIVETEKHAAVIGAKAYYGGPTVFALVVSGKFLLAGMNFGGVYRSTNNGGSWSVTNEGFTSSTPMGPPSISTLAVSADYLFAGTIGDGIFLSTNNGRQWTGASNGLPADGRSVYCPINALVSVPKEKRIDGEMVFAATEGAGIFLTTDDGRRWVPVNNGLRNPVIYSLAAWTGSGRVKVFAGAGDGVYLAVTNSSAWTNVTAGMPQAKVYALAVSGDTLYAAVARNGVWRRSISEMIVEGARKP